MRVFDGHSKPWSYRACRCWNLLCRGAWYSGAKVVERPFTRANERVWNHLAAWEPSRDQVMRSKGSSLRVSR